jgi:hypothetical protein
MKHALMMRQHSFAMATPSTSLLNFISQLLPVRGFFRSCEMNLGSIPDGWSVQYFCVPAVSVRRA